MEQRTPTPDPRHGDPSTTAQLRWGGGLIRISWWWRLVLSTKLKLFSRLVAESGVRVAAARLFLRVPCARRVDRLDKARVKRQGTVPGWELYHDPVLRGGAATTSRASRSASYHGVASACPDSLGRASRRGEADDVGHAESDEGGSGIGVFLIF